MIWSFIKIVVFVAIVAALTLLAGHLADQGTGLRLVVANTEFTLGPLQAAIAGVLAVVAVWIGLKLLGLLVATLRFLNGDETAISRYFNRNRERKGFEALAEGMMAIASGDGRVAMSKAARAEKFLERPELTNLLMAQAAELAGDTRRAIAVLGDIAHLGERSPELHAALASAVEDANPDLPADCTQRRCGTTSLHGGTLSC